MNVVTSILLGILSFNCFATSCFISDELIKNESIKQADKVKIDVHQKGSMRQVKISLPQEIDGERLQGIILHKSAEGGELNDFSIPLNLVYEHKRALAWYFIEQSFFENNYVTISYGESCGLSLKYMVSNKSNP